MLDMIYRLSSILVSWKANAVDSFGKNTVSYVFELLIYCYLYFSLVMGNAAWSRGDSGRPARAHKVLIKFLIRSTNLELVKDTFKLYNVTFEN